MVLHRVMVGKWWKDAHTATETIDLVQMLVVGERKKAVHAAVESIMFLSWVVVDNW